MHPAVAKAKQIKAEEERAAAITVMADLLNQMAERLTRIEALIKALEHTPKAEPAKIQK